MTSALGFLTGSKIGNPSRSSIIDCSCVTYKDICSAQSKPSHEMHTYTLKLGKSFAFDQKCSTLRPCALPWSPWQSSRSILESLPEYKTLGFRSMHHSSTNPKKIAQIRVSCCYSPGSAQGDGMGGDPKVQKMLVEMLQIQVGKARMSDFVDERSQLLRNIAHEALEEYDRIAYRTMKEFEATGSRVLRELDADASAIERELQIARAEMERQSKDFEEFQIRSAYSRNEGLFFKTLYEAPRVLGYKSTYPSGKFPEVTELTVISPSPRKELSTTYTKVLYGGLSLVIVSFICSSSSAFLSGTWMRPSKLASYGAIIVSLLLTRLAYNKALSGEVDHDSDKEEK